MFRLHIITALLKWKEKSNKLNKMKHCFEIHLEFILHYITFTRYCIVNDTFRLRGNTILLIWKEKAI